MAALLQLNTGTLQNSQLSALQKIDSSIVAILTASPHVAVYIFKQGAKQWERKNIEGPLYLVRRSTLPQFSFVILNRKGNQHMVELIDVNFEFSQQDPYIIFRNTKAQDPMPHGMWFKSDQDRQKVWQQVQQIKTTLERRANNGGGGGSGGGNIGSNNGGKSRNSGNGGRGNGNTPQLSQQVQQMNMNDPNLTPNQVELSKTQLQKMLLAMMKSEKFVDMLHTQYITALRKRRATQQRQ
jgi:hypothetical protein